MSKFINKLKEYYTMVKNSNAHQIKMMILSFIIMALLHMSGSGIMFSILTSLVAGVLIEIVHCFMPKKTVKILAWQIDVPDYKTFVATLKNHNVRVYHEMSDNNAFYNIVGISLYIVIRLVILFF